MGSKPFRSGPLHNQIKAVPFEFNEETRFRVSVNESPEYIFTWDSDLKRLTAIGNDAATMPDNLEVAIAKKLQSLKF